MRFSLIFVLFLIIESTFVYSTSRPNSPKAIRLDEWSKLVEAPSDHNPLKYSSYSPPRSKTPPHKAIDLKEWSKLVEVPIEHKPLEYPSLDSPIKEHERVNKLHFSKEEPVKNIHPGKERKQILETGIIETHIPTRRAQLKALIQTKKATNAHIEELEKIRNRERKYKQNSRSNKLRSPSPLHSDNEFDWTSFLANSPDTHISNQNTQSQDTLFAQEESNKPDLPTAKTKKRKRQPKPLDDEQAKLKKKQDNQRWYKIQMERTKSDPKRLEAYQTKYKNRYKNKKAKMIDDPEEKLKFLQRAREYSAKSRKKVYKHLKETTGFCSKETKQYHESAQAIKAGTATEEDRKVVEKRRMQSKIAYYKKINRKMPTKEEKKT